MEQIGLALILFAAFWVGCAAGYIAMRLRASVAYEKGRIDSAAEIAALIERLAGRDQQCNEATQRAAAAAESIARLEAEARTEADRRATAEARVSLLPKYEAELESRAKNLAQQQHEIASLTARLEESKKSSDESAANALALQNQFAESFQAMTAEALNSNNKVFLDLAGDTLTRLRDSAAPPSAPPINDLGLFIEPLKSSLDRVDTRIGELEAQRSAALFSLQQQVESMMRTQAALQAETSQLATALRTPASRGSWGEVQLRRVVELAGMVPHCDFVESTSADNPSSPNLTVKLPNQRVIVVDSHVALSASLDSNDAPAEFAAAVRAHLTRLSAKEYWDQFPTAPEFVVAFLPGEAFFSAALQADPELLEFGVERRVILATPTTLIALLRAVAWGWNQETVSVNAKEFRDLGKALYDRLRSLADNFTEVQRGLSRTTAAFNRTVGCFDSSVAPAARRLRDLGAASGEELVSPSPIDSTPRSLHLLAEATGAAEPPIATEPVLVLRFPNPAEEAAAAS